MTDARIPERWLNDRRYLQLSDAAFRLAITALTWSVANRTEGVIAPADLDLMIGIDKAKVTDLIDADVWASRDNAWTIVDFEETQTSKSDLEALDRRRRSDRERKRRSRADSHVTPGEETASRDNAADGHVTTLDESMSRDNQRDVQRTHQGQDKDRHLDVTTSAGTGPDCDECRRKAVFGSGPCPEHRMAS